MGWDVPRWWGESRSTRRRDGVAGRGSARARGLLVDRHSGRHRDLRPAVAIQPAVDIQPIVDARAGGIVADADDVRRADRRIRDVTPAGEQRPAAARLLVGGVDRATAGRARIVGSLGAPRVRVRRRG